MSARVYREPRTNYRPPGTPKPCPSCGRIVKINHLGTVPRHKIKPGGEMCRRADGRRW